jgi:hypothetical protein
MGVSISSGDLDGTGGGLEPCGASLALGELVVDRGKGTPDGEGDRFCGVRKLDAVTDVAVGELVIGAGEATLDSDVLWLVSSAGLDPGCCLKFLSYSRLTRSSKLRPRSLSCSQGVAVVIELCAGSDNDGGAEIKNIGEAGLFELSGAGSLVGGEVGVDDALFRSRARTSSKDGGG